MFLSVKDKRATILEAQEIFVAIEPGEDVGDFLSVEEAKAQGVIEEVPARYRVEVVGSIPSSSGLMRSINHKWQQPLKLPTVSRPVTIRNANGRGRPMVIIAL